MSLKKNKTAEKTNQPPVDEVRIGLQKASIWENETKDGTFYSVSFDRRYQDEKGNWHSATDTDSATCDHNASGFIRSLPERELNTSRQKKYA